MPELPEVHTTVTELGKLIVGKTILNVWSGYDSPHYYGKEQVKDPAYFKKFKEAILGATITSTSRIGKNVLIHLNTGDTILVHMKMTGHLLFGNYSYNKEERTWTAVGDGPLRSDKWNGFIRMVFSFTDSTRMALSDLRKFAKVQLINTEELGRHPELPDPLSETFTLSIFKNQLRKRPTGKIKQVLMDQELVAGVGNIYSDEALWIAGIHPTRLIKKLNDAEFKKLFRAIQEILKAGIDFQGDSTSDYRTPLGTPGSFHHKHQVYRRTGQPCTREGCTGTIERLVIGGRSAHFCNTCQK
jgi:formamidopyrimidine-DNA glycosylase